MTKAKMRQPKYSKGNHDVKPEPALPFDCARLPPLPVFVFDNPEFPPSSWRIHREFMAVLYACH